MFVEYLLSCGERPYENDRHPVSSELKVLGDSGLDGYRHGNLCGDGVVDIDVGLWREDRDN